MVDSPPPEPVGSPVSSSLRHDLRTPLNQIIGYGEMLAEEAASAGREDWLRDLRRIVQAAKGMVDRVDRAFAPVTDTPWPAPPPLESPPPLEPSATARTALPDAGLRPGKLLVVDDSESNRDMLSRRLERQGHITALAENGRAALTLLAQEAFDLVLLDVMMPVMDGCETLARLKADPRLRDIPVIMISAQTELDSVVRCIELGAEDYLPKPFNPVLLRARVGASLEKKRLREQEQAHREQALRSEAALERHRALAQMVAGVAHEINTPLGIACTALSVIENRLSNPKLRAFAGSDEAGEELLADILDSAALLKNNVIRAHKLVETFKKISVSQANEAKEPANLPELVTDAVDLFRINARRAKLSINVDCAGLTGDPQWLGHPGLLTQVVMNFLQNIERYAYPDGQGGKVGIIVADQGEADDARFTLTVRDYGAGIGPGHLAKIFDPFFTTGRGQGGSGLGLAIVQNIVTSALQGRISASSEPGQGTAFVVSFPKSIADPD
ncbi:response regulator [Methylomagnum sp.]